MAGSLHTPLPDTKPYPCLRGGGLFKPKPFFSSSSAPPSCGNPARSPTKLQVAVPHAAGTVPPCAASPRRQRRLGRTLFCEEIWNSFTLSLSEGLFFCSWVKHTINSWNSHNNKLITTALVLLPKATIKQRLSRKQLYRLDHHCLARVHLLLLAMKSLVTLSSSGKQLGGSQSPPERL